MEGKTVTFNFAIPGKLTFYGFEARKIADSEDQGQPAVVIQIGLANPVLSLFSDPIVVTYQRETRRLVQYEGVSNLRDADLNNYHVRIVYPQKDVVNSVD